MSESSADRLRALYDELPQEVKLVYGQGDAYERIIDVLQSTVGDPDQIDQVALSHQEMTNQLAEVVRVVESAPTQVASWQGAARGGFEESIAQANDKLGRLTALTEQAALVLQTATAGLGATQRLIEDLVRASLDYSVTTLRTAQSLALVTAGTSMSNWAVDNLQQVRRLLEQVEDNTDKVQELVTKLSGLLEGIVAEVDTATSDLMTS